MSHNEFHLGCKVRYEYYDKIDITVFGDRIKVLSKDKWYLTKYVCFQQKIESIDNLNPKNLYHRGVIRILEKEGLLSPFKAPLMGLSWGKGKSKSMSSKE